MNEENINIENWVERERDPRKKSFRQAVHTILFAIASPNDLDFEMIMKGGILLSIRYESTRYTTDIDFSTSMKIQNCDVDSFINAFKKRLIYAVETLNYGLDCRLQSYKQNPPPSPEVNFPTLKIKIGYAYKNDDRGHRRLIDKKATTVVEVDYSFNEIIDNIDCVSIDNTRSISVYSLEDTIAEKLRAIIQQKTRNRIRRQDAYDIYYLIGKHPISDSKQKEKILHILTKKAESRDIELRENTITDPEIKERSRKEYSTLSYEIEEDLPDFETVFSTIVNLYKSLPWPIA